MKRLVHQRTLIIVTMRAEMPDESGNQQIKDNAITIAWHTPLSFNPELYGIAVAYDRYSYKMLKKAGSFVVNFVPESMGDVAMECGMLSGADTDKFAELELKTQEAETVKAFRLTDAVGWLECEIISESEAGDHAFLIGRVKRVDAIEKAKFFIR